MRAASPWVLLVGVAGCHGDEVASTGELGRLSYTLHIDYELDPRKLTDMSLLSGHDLELSVSPTEQGEREGGNDLGHIQHRSSDAVLDSAPTSEVPAVPGFTIRADAGTVLVESMLDDRVFDQIHIAFADPDVLDVVTWVRGPWDVEWNDASAVGALEVEAGTQIAVLAIPMAGEERLAGNFVPEITVDPPGLIVPDQDVYAVQEGGVTWSSDSVTFYAVSAGTAVMTIADPVHGLSIPRVVTIR